MIVMYTIDNCVSVIYIMLGQTLVNTKSENNKL